MTESQIVADIARVLITHGPVYSGGDQRTAEMIADDWLDHGFDAETTDEWCSAGCWTASVAAEFADAGMTPRNAARACQRYDERHGKTRGMDAMYAACNADLSTDMIIDDYRAS